MGGSSTWDTYFDFEPETNIESQELLFRQYITDDIIYLYNSSSRIAGSLDNWVAAGPLRIGNGGTQFAFYFPKDFPPQPGATDVTNDQYIGINPFVTMWTIDKTGNFFAVENSVVLGHEIGHSTGTTDALYDATAKYVTDAMMNAVGYNYVGTALEFEQEISADLGIASTRTFHHTGITMDDIRYSELFTHEGSFTQGYEVDIIRFGDQTKAVMNNVMDLSTSSSTKGVLAFGFGGDDFITGTIHNDHLYGGVGDDTIDSDHGDDRIYGDDGNDTINAGDGADAIFGGAGINEIYGGDGDDYIVGGNDYNTIYSEAGHDIIKTGLGYTTVYGGKGDMICAGDGVDTFYFSSSVPSSSDDPTAITIHDLGNEDLIYLDGLRITGRDWVTTGVTGSDGQWYTVEEKRQNSWLPDFSEGGESYNFDGGYYSTIHLDGINKSGSYGKLQINFTYNEAAPAGIVVNDEFYGDPMPWIM
jgi:hypothetical protein